jgi:glycosyltransferase involved in cell wall biosynthesis
LDKPAVTLICPAYYDEKNIGPLVRRSVEVLRSFCSQFEIIVVEDGSPDGTGRVAEDLSNEFPDIVVAVHHNRNRGHGAALKSGFKHARYSTIAFLDGDGQYDPNDLPAMIEMLNGLDLVQGRRRKYPNGPARTILSKIYNAIVRGMFDVPYRDLGCAIKVMNRKVFERSSPNGNGIFAQGELVLRAHAADFRVGEALVECRPREYGRSNSVSLKNVRIMCGEMKKLKSEWKK